MRSPAKILIVEDEGIVAFNLQQRLQHMGYQVAGVAESGRECLSLVDAQRPDLVLMDIHIKGEMDGIDVADALGQLPRGAVPVIYLTAYSEDATLERARQTHPYGYLIKPFSERELHATIQMALERHHMQRAFNENQHLLAQALQSANMGSLECDPEAGTVRTAGASARRLGVAEHAAVPLARVLEAVVDEDRPAVTRCLLGRVAGRFSQEFRTRMPGEDLRWLRMDGATLDDGRTSCVVQDVTQAKQAAEALQLANEALEARVQERTRELQQSMKELEAFNHTVAHDLRAPLRAISGMSLILTEEHAPALGQEGVAMLDRITTSVRHMGSLIDALLNMSRLSRQDIRLSRLDLSELALEVLKTLRDAEPHRACELQVQSGIRVVADLALMRSVMDNLLRNAWKFSGREAVIRIEVGSETLDGETVHFVRDHGCGFDSAKASRLFDPFCRLHTERDYAGTGLGLSIVHRIVTRHGGRVWAESAPGQGATFRFTLGPARGSDNRE
ncbi:MAG: response regulator [Hydrogenophaga sp.]|nr:response regulator [Hydrogenophaga sp.]